MKFLFVTQNYTPSKGGMAESCSRIVKNLRKSGHIVHVFHFTNRQKPYLTKKENNGCYSALGIYDTEEYTLNLATLFLENEKNLEFDVVVAFGGYLPMMWTPIISKLLKKPLYTCIRGNDFDEGLFSKKRNVLFYALENSDGILSVSSDKQSKIEALFPNNSVYFTPNGIDSDFWQLSDNETQKAIDYKNSLSDKKVVLIAGQLKFKKGIRNFVEGFSEFPHQNEYEIWFIGDISEEVRAFINKFNINIRFFPFASKQEMKMFYKMADLVCIPSFYDGMPNVLLEAGASQKLVIATNVGGIPDVISHQKNGLLYNPLQSNSLIDVFISYHHLSEEEKTRMSENLCKTISENFSEQSEMKNYLDIFNTLNQ